MNRYREEEGAGRGTLFSYLFAIPFETKIAGALEGEESFVTFCKHAVFFSFYTHLGPFAVFELKRHEIAGMCPSLPCSTLHQSPLRHELGPRRLLWGLVIAIPFAHTFERLE